MQKLSRAVIGTNNIDNCSRYCQAARDGRLFSHRRLREIPFDRRYSAGETGHHYWKQYRGKPSCAATRVKRAHKLHGQKLIVPIFAKTKWLAARIFTCIRNRAQIFCLCAVSRYLIDNNLHNPRSESVGKLDWRNYKKSLEPFTMEFASEKTGHSVEL